MPKGTLQNGPPAPARGVQGVPPGPLSTVYSLRPMKMSDGESAVVVTLQTPNGTFHFWWTANAAIDLARDLKNCARASRGEPPETEAAPPAAKRLVVPGRG